MPAEHAINGMYYDNLEHLGYAVPESFGLKNFKNTADIEINILRWWQHRIFRNSGVSADGTEIYLDTIGSHRPKHGLFRPHHMDRKRV